MTDDKKALLEIRAMTWDEYCKFEDFKEEYLEAHKDEVGTRKFGQALIGWVADNIYPDVKDALTPAEIVVVFNTTKALSEAIRTDEIKNLPTSLVGNMSEAATAKTAEK